MPVKTVKDIDLKNKRVLMRVDFNVPVKDGEVTDDTRIKAVLPTLKYIIEQEGTSVVLMSHLGRPKGEKKPEYSLKPVASRLSELIGKEVRFADDCVGEEVKKQASALKAGEILLLENVRFHKEETENDKDFARQLASLGQVFVNDAFGAAHRAHASTEGVARYLTGVAGFLLEKEIAFFEPLLKKPEQPFVAIIGGAKISTKIGVLQNLMSLCSTLIIGGGMAYTFLKARGHSIGRSMVEEEFIPTAKKLLDQAGYSDSAEIILPTDHIVASEFSEKAEAEYVDGIDIPDDKVAMDIGPKTIENVRDKIINARSLVWNGPMGVFEFDSFSKGTLEIARLVAGCKGRTVVGGGDSVAAVNKFKLTDKIDHVSTGGGASLEFLEGKILPGIAILQQRGKDA